MNYMLKLLGDSQSAFKTTDDKSIIITENELTKALEYVYDKGMKWAYHLMMNDIQKREKGIE